MNASVTWDPHQAGVLALPSGRLVRGRGLLHPRHGAGRDHEHEHGHGHGHQHEHERPDANPDFGLYLLGRKPPEFTWTARWLRWPDFWLPLDRSDAHEAIGEAWTRAQHERVEVACGGGRGRTGTALACMAVLDGVPPRVAVDYVRAKYDAHAVETPWQRRYVSRFLGAARDC